MSCAHAVVLAEDGVQRVDETFCVGLGVGARDGTTNAAVTKAATAISRVETIWQVLPMDGLTVRGRKVDARQRFSAFAVSHSILHRRGSRRTQGEPERDR